MDSTNIALSGADAGGASIRGARPLLTVPHTCHPRQLRGVGGGITTAMRNIDALGAATMRIWRFKLPAV